MLKLALRNLAAGKVRLLLTTLLIVIGVGFVSSSFILRDGLKDVFGNLAQEVVAGIDVGVSALDPTSDPITEADLQALDSVDGIADAVLEITGEGAENLIQPIKADGTTITLQGPPQIAFGWTDGPTSALSVVEGREPTAANEWVVDPQSAEEHSFVIGDSYDFITPSGRQSGELVGTFTFDGFVEGPTFMSMTRGTLQEYLVYGDRYDAISIAADGSVPVPELIESISAALNPDTFARVSVQNQEELVADASAGFNQALDIIGGILLGFALLSLFVSIFIIVIIFAITVGQRTRELGLLRAIGSTPGQVLRSVMAESFLIGLLASILGLIGGAIIALLIRAALNAAGLGIPPFGIVIKPLTVLVAFAVGIGVTMLAATFPAFSASRTSPISAITGSSEKKEKSGARYIIGLVVAAIGGGLMLLGLFGGADSVTGVLVPLGFGAAISFVGIALLTPLIAGPLSKTLGKPLELIFNTPGRLAKDNAARNPRRTGTIASTLMIGLTAVSMAFVLGESFTAEFDRILNTSVQGDYLVTSDQADIPDEVVEQIVTNDAFGNVTAVKYWGVDLVNTPVDPEATGVSDGNVDRDRGIGYSADLAAFDYTQIEGLFNLSVIEGDLANMTENTTALRTNITEDLGVGLGDTITVFLSDGEVTDLDIVAIFEEAQVASGVLVTFDRFDDISSQRTSDWIAAKRSEGTSVEAADLAFADIGADYPNLAFQSSAEFRQSFSDQINFILRIITILLTLTILVSLVGILATVALSVFERVREIGLLRAVGSTRKQIFTTVLWEGGIICGVGAILGAVLGIGLGALILNAIPGDIISQVAIPWISILVMVLVSSILGLFAALLPAIWASRLNVLDAISH